MKSTTVSTTASSQHPNHALHREQDWYEKRAWTSALTIGLTARWSQQEAFLGITKTCVYIVTPASPTESRSTLSMSCVARVSFALLIRRLYAEANAMIIAYIFVTTERVSLLLIGLKNRHGHWLCWMSTGRKNGLMWRTHTHIYAPILLWLFAWHKEMSCSYPILFLLVEKQAPTSKHKNIHTLP